MGERKRKMSGDIEQCAPLFFPSDINDLAKPCVGNNLIYHG
jgi:hypothetical protein